MMKKPRFDDMVNSWEAATKKFLGSITQEYVGVLVCGSYVTGNPDDHSDIDLHIILPLETPRRRGTRIIGTYLVEYFMNDANQIREYFAKDHENYSYMAATQFITGQILYDENGVVKELMQEAKQWRAKPLPELQEKRRTALGYHAWDATDNAIAAFKADELGKYAAYHEAVRVCVEAACKALRHPVLQARKAPKLLTSQRFREKYIADSFPDEAVKHSIIQAYKAENPVEDITRLRDETHRVLGGFDVHNAEI